MTRPAGDPIPAVIARREMLRNRFVAHIEEDLHPPYGGDPYTYHTVKATWDAVIVIPLLDDGRLIVERIYRHPYRSWIHEFPAGGIDHGEDACAAGARELEEETGWIAGRTRLLHRFAAMPGLLHMSLNLVLAEDLRDGGSKRLENMELLHAEAMTEEAAWELANRELASSFLVMGLLALARTRAPGHLRTER